MNIVDTRLQQLWPWCAKCNKPVQAMKGLYSPVKTCSVYVAFCHGEEEETELTDQLLIRIGPDGLKRGVAFNARKTQDLPEPSKSLEHLQGKL